MATLSSDLIWEITRECDDAVENRRDGSTIDEDAGGHSATLVKRKEAGGVQFSRDKLNLRNKYSRKVRTAISSWRRLAN